jgi:hypothetical protein
MEVIYSSETYVDIQMTTQRYIPEDRILYDRRCVNLEFYTWCLIRDGVKVLSKLYIPATDMK